MEDERLINSDRIREQEFSNEADKSPHMTFLSAFCKINEIITAILNALEGDNLSQKIACPCYIKFFDAKCLI